jgi:hypothetical protein
MQPKKANAKPVSPKRSTAQFISRHSHEIQRSSIVTLIPQTTQFPTNEGFPKDL